MRETWSDTYRTQKYLDWEAALAGAEAKLGTIPKQAADDITRVCKVENIDFEAYAKKDTLTIGYPVLGLVGSRAGQDHWSAVSFHCMI
jgi:3-carboxy-cis,cis-muconate cycloisomerase